MAVLILACGSPDFYVNPTAAPTLAASPDPSPTAQVFRIVPAENPPTSTPTPPPNSGSSVLNNPRSLITHAMEHIIRYRDHAVVSGRFFRALPLGDGAKVENGTDSEDWPEIMVTVAGEYSAEPIANPDGRWGPDQDVNFHLRFHHEPVSVESGQAPESWSTEIEVKQKRFFKDTTSNNFRTYSTYAQWIAMVGIEWTFEDMPTLSTFLGLALTENLILERDMPVLMLFDEAHVIAPLGEGGSDLWVIGSTRTQPNGDVEKWTFWIDEDEMPRKIGLTIENESDPSRRLWNAELEISEIGKCLPHVPCR
jgi:hypothetical protein